MFKVRFHNLFKPKSYSAAFRNKEYRDRFEKGLTELRKSGRVDENFRKYIDPARGPNS